MSNSKFLVVVNPLAGKKKVKEEWPKILNLLKEYGVEFDVEFIKYRHQAIKLVKNKI